MAQDWSAQEVKLIVADYFAMLQDELKGLPVNKKEHRLRLLPLLDSRSDGSVEFKHQNISAVLAKLGSPYIKGYKPRANYQQLLENEVVRHLARLAPRLNPLFETFSKEAIPEKAGPDVDFAHCVEPAPPPSKPTIQTRKFRPSKINYLEKEQNNRTLGAGGEKFVIEYEQWRLRRARRTDLIPLIEWTARDKGDGAGFDILSKNTDGSNRYIEVKTTKLSKETPIYLTSTELDFAARHAGQFYLYRVFNFTSNRKLFIQAGSYNDFCQLLPTTYKGIF